MGLEVRRSKILTVRLAPAGFSVPRAVIRAAHPLPFAPALTRSRGPGRACVCVVGLAAPSSVTMMAWEERGEQAMSATAAAFGVGRHRPEALCEAAVRRSP